MSVPRYFAMVAALTAPLCAVSTPKAEVVQTGYCANWPDMPNTLKADSYQALFSGLAFTIGKDNVDLG